MSTSLSRNERYTFGRLSGNSVIVASSDNVEGTKLFRAGIEVSSSGATNPLVLKPGSNGYGLELFANSENQLVAELKTSVDDAVFRMYADGTEKIELTTSGVTTPIHIRSQDNSSSHNIALFQNSDDLIGLKVRNDGRIHSEGANLWLFDSGGSDYIKLFKSGDNAYLDAHTNGHVFLRPNAGTNRFLAHGTEAVNVSYGDMRPSTDDSFDLGTTSFKWDDVRATNSTIQTSDRNLKTQITSSNLGLAFINDLNPVSYKWIGKNRNHYGLIAQEVSESLAKHNVNTDDFAGYIKDDIYNRIEYISGSDDANPESNVPLLLSESVDYSLHYIQKYGLDVNDFTFVSSSLSLRYGELISPLIKAVQELSAEVETLKARITTLEG